MPSYRSKLLLVLERIPNVPLALAAAPGATPRAIAARTLIAEHLAALGALIDLDVNLVDTVELLPLLTILVDDGLQLGRDVLRVLDGEDAALELTDKGHHQIFKCAHFNLLF
jgi:hypothetical protein